MVLDGKYLDRFLSRVVRGPGCWTWDGAHTSAGYCESWDGVRVIYAHRVAYEMWVGPIPDGYEVDHFVCSNQGCINPAHLRAVTPHENNMRSTSQAAVNARKTHCIRGHEFTAGNTYMTATGSRSCRACWRVRNITNWARVRDSRPSRDPGLRTHCPQGHPYNEANTYRYAGKNGRTERQCRTCQRARAAAQRRNKIMEV